MVISSSPCSATCAPTSGRSMRRMAPGWHLPPPAAVQRWYICEVNGTKDSLQSTAAPTMDNTSSLNTPEVSTASQQQLHNYEDEALEVNLASSLEVNPPSFDPALFLDETIDFMDPQATKQENIPEFDDMNTWTEQVMAEVLDMEH